MSQAEEVTGPVRMLSGVEDYLRRGTTPVELAEAETSAAAGDGGRSYESAVACLSRGTEPSRPRESVGIVTLLGEALGQEGGTADPEAGA